MNNPWKETASQIYEFGERGFDFFELTVEFPYATPEKLEASKKEITDALSSYNFGVVAHCPWYFSVAHPYLSIQKAINAEFEKGFAAAALFGAKKITVHTEWMPAHLQEKQLKAAKTAETLEWLASIAQENGMRLLVENMGCSSFCVEDFEWTFSKVDAGLTLDVGHACIEGEFENYIKKLKKKIEHIHLHDNDRRSDLHLPLGAGKLGISKIVKRLKEFYNGTITLEIHSDDLEYLKISRDKLEILWYGKKKYLENKKYMGMR
ncbi:MAG: sugar phosphate isomerase/epimerase family protein [Candidatus Anstonellaceae archaeon]